MKAGCSTGKRRIGRCRSQSLLCWTTLWAALLSAVASPLAPSCPAAESDDEFATKLDYLRRLWMPDVGKDAVVKAFEEFIDEYQDDPRVAEAMIHLGGLMLNNWPEKGIHADPAAASEWFRKAAAKAVPGSETWIKVQFILENGAVHSSPAEARRILKEITSHAQGDWLILARVEDRLHSVCLAEGDLDAAERHCRRLLDWDRDPARVPTDPLRKRDLDMLQASCASGMIEALIVAPMPKAERAKRIQGVMGDYGFQSLQSEGRRALKRLEKMPEFHRMDPVAMESRWIDWLRWTMVLASVVVVLTIGWVLLIRKRRQA